MRCIQHIFTQFVLIEPITLPEAQLHSKGAALISCSHYKHSFIEETHHVHRFILMQLKSLLTLCRMELRCVIAVIRHGDRTPKQKMKMEVRNPM